MDKTKFKKYITGSNFQELFTDLMWNIPTEDDMPPVCNFGCMDYIIKTVAELQGFHILLCPVSEIPSSAICRTLDQKIRNIYHDYICVFAVPQTTLHKWVIPVKKVEKRDLVYIQYDSAEKAVFLYEKITKLHFGINESPTIIDVKERVNATFIINSEKVTNDFYREFKKQHLTFASLITGIKDHIPYTENDDKLWYTSVMLNRLMFCYFIQKKLFLNGEENYLRNRLDRVKKENGEDQFYASFYRGFLLSLFHDGLNSPRHNLDFKEKYGKIPYLNGGLFGIHELEEKNPTIDIADEAFEKLFDFFDKWNWHLDDRLTANGKDINPDVLGYIFEQYINDKAKMGAYYTKEDITEYIGRSTIVPYLMDATRKAYPQAFEKEGEVWTILKNSDDKYIFDAVKKGQGKEFPEDISIGLDTNQPNLLERRARWNDKTPESFAIPTEIWRETIERLQRYNTIKKKIAMGEISEFNDFITYNLDIRQFVQDVLEQTADKQFVKSFYAQLRKVTILDPTCGSGAFLFAALNILEPLYEKCIKKMQSWAEQGVIMFNEEIGEIPEEYRANIQYFIYKNIILRNLYGVDYMVEAVEIAKLRLFLKMVACVEYDSKDDNLGIEPLPDMDFNIRCGNTLVGYATEKELDAGIANTMNKTEDFRSKIEEELNKVRLAYQDFKCAQFSDRESLSESKKVLKEDLNNLNKDLNKLLYKASSTIDYNTWYNSYKPFHWVAEFYEIINGNGGFDVIIGNPPYVVYNDNNYIYKIRDYITFRCNDLYAYVIERSLRICSNSMTIGMIVPISIVSTDGFADLRRLLLNNKLEQWYSNYSMRPSKLFEGAEKHLSILIAKINKPIIYTSKYYRWYKDARKYLFDGISYVKCPPNLIQVGAIPKVGDLVGVNILKKIRKDRGMLFSSCTNSSYLLYHTRKLRYYVQFLDRAPIIYNEDGSLRVTSELKTIKYDSDNKRYSAIAVYLSTLFFWYFIAHSDCRNLNKREVDMFPFSLHAYCNIDLLSKLGHEIQDNLQGNSTFIEATYQRYGKLKMQKFQPRLSKEIADKIDRALAMHYGFTDEELDFIINYDIKYRMGDELNDDE